MPFTRINGAKLHYEDSGGDGEVIVFSHGLLHSCRMFDPQVVALSGHYRCVAYDHRGQGQSEVPSGSVVAIETVYEDAVALIESLGVGPVHFVGLSMGGFVGMRLAARRPDLLRSVVLLETAADEEPRQNLPKYTVLKWLARTLGVGVVARRVMPILFGPTFLSDPLRRAEVRLWRDRLSTNKRNIYKAVNGVLKRSSVVHELGAITCPALVIHGDEDKAIVLSRGQALCDGIAGATMVTIAGAGHSSTIEQPDAVNAALIDFYDGLDQPASRATPSGAA